MASRKADTETETNGDATTMELEVPAGDELGEAIGNSIAALRSAQRMTQRELAEACGLTDSAISLIESGGRVNLITIDHICRELGLRWIGDLFEFIEHYGSRQAIERSMRKRGARGAGGS